jgi:hypothetical protein
VVVDAGEELVEPTLDVVVDSVEELVADSVVELTVADSVVELTVADSVVELTVAVRLDELVTDPVVELSVENVVNVVVEELDMLVNVALLVLDEMDVSVVGTGVVVGAGNVVVSLPSVVVAKPTVAAEEYQPPEVDVVSQASTETNWTKRSGLYPAARTIVELAPVTSVGYASDPP